MGVEELYAHGARPGTCTLLVSMRMISPNWLTTISSGLVDEVDAGDLADRGSMGTSTSP